jgi:hypothetical protein
VFWVFSERIVLVVSLVVSFWLCFGCFQNGLFWWCLWWCLFGGVLGVFRTDCFGGVFGGVFLVVFFGVFWWGVFGGVFGGVFLVVFLVVFWVFSERIAWSLKLGASQHLYSLAVANCGVLDDYSIAASLGMTSTTT